jgi:hypothetical protein
VCPVTLAHIHHFFVSAHNRLLPHYLVCSLGSARAGAPGDISITPSLRGSISGGRTLFPPPATPILEFAPFFHSSAPIKEAAHILAAPISGSTSFLQLHHGSNSRGRTYVGEWLPSRSPASSMRAYDCLALFERAHQTSSHCSGSSLLDTYEGGRPSLVPLCVQYHWRTTNPSSVLCSAQHLSKGTTTSLSPWCVRASALDDKTSLRLFATSSLEVALFLPPAALILEAALFFHHDFRVILQTLCQGQAGA